ncbi:MAG: ABC transporter permease [Parcubacteria group bacterium]
MADKPTIYEPDNSIRQGYFSTFGEISVEFIKNRWLMTQLFKREFFSMYRQSFVGVFWAFIMPLISVSTFIILNRAGIFAVGDMTVPYPLFAITGIAFWQLFSSGINGCSNALVKAESMLTKINFSKKSLVISSVGQAVVSFGVQILLALALYGYYHIVPSWVLLLLPLLALPILILSVGVGLILSLLNGILRDIGNMMTVFLSFIMFLTPILYVRPASGFLATFTHYNILYYLTSLPRDFILTGKMSSGLDFLIATIIAVIVFIICLFAFHLTETRVAERI